MFCWMDWGILPFTAIVIILNDREMIRSNVPIQQISNTTPKIVLKMLIMTWHPTDSKHTLNYFENFVWFFFLKTIRTKQNKNGKLVAFCAAQLKNANCKFNAWMNIFLITLLLLIFFMVYLFILHFLYLFFFIWFFIFHEWSCPFVLQCSVEWNTKKCFRIYVHSYQVQGISTLLYEKYWRWDCCFKYLCPFVCSLVLLLINYIHFMKTVANFTITRFNKWHILQE